MDLQLARTLIESGHKLPEVKERTGITQALYGQIKRELKHKDWGCVVCGGKKRSFNFCRHHLWIYVHKPREHARIKRLRGYTRLHGGYTYCNPLFYAFKRNEGTF